MTDPASDIRPIGDGSFEFDPRGIFVDDSGDVRPTPFDLAETERDLRLVSSFGSDPEGLEVLEDESVVGVPLEPAVQHLGQEAAASVAGVEVVSAEPPEETPTAADSVAVAGDSAPILTPGERLRQMALRHVGDPRNEDARIPEHVFSTDAVERAEESVPESSQRPEEISIKELSREEALELARFRIVMGRLVKALGEVRKAEGLLISEVAQRKRVIEVGTTVEEVVDRAETRKATNLDEAERQMQALKAMGMGKDYTYNEVNSMYFGRRDSKTMRNRLRRRIEKDREYLLSQGWIEEEQD